MERQIRVGKMLGLGFACSLIWAGGVGSLIALIIGLRARKIIKRSSGQVSGIRMAWWCIVVGAFGLLTILPYVIWLVIKAMRNE